MIREIHINYANSDASDESSWKKKSQQQYFTDSHIFHLTKLAHETGIQQITG